MRTLLAIAVLLTAQTAANPTLDTTQLSWMRTIDVAPGTGDTACTTLDAELYHRAAPALRDLRLTMAGSELPFAIEESYDEHSLATGITASADRSFYDTVATAQTTGDSDTQRAHFALPAHVPVERVHLLNGAVRTETAITIQAHVAEAVETVNGIIPAGASVFPVTLGANLQNDTDVQIDLHHSGLANGARIALEMRRRWICFPSSGNGTRALYFGNTALHAAAYDYARNFRMPSEPRKAHIGPVANNPAFQSPPVKPRWLLPAIFASLLATVITFFLGWSMRAALIKTKRNTH